MNLENFSFNELVEVRFAIEVEIVKMAAKRRTIDDIVVLTNALSAFEKKVAEGAKAVEENTWFYLKIADAAKNNTLKSLILLISSKSLKFYKEQKLKDNLSLLVEKNQLILDHIIYQKSDIAIQMMKEQFIRNQYQELCF